MSLSAVVAASGSANEVVAMEANKDCNGQQSIISDENSVDEAVNKRSAIAEVRLPSTIPSCPLTTTIPFVGSGSPPSLAVSPSEIWRSLQVVPRTGVGLAPGSPVCRRSDPSRGPQGRRPPTLPRRQCLAPAFGHPLPHTPSSPTLCPCKRPRSGPGLT